MPYRALAHINWEKYFEQKSLCLDSARLAMRQAQPSHFPGGMRGQQPIRARLRNERLAQAGRRPVRRLARIALHWDDLVGNEFPDTRLQRDQIIRECKVHVRFLGRWYIR